MAERDVPADAETLRRRRNERLYALLRAVREVPEPTSGLRVGLLTYNETRAYDAIVAVIDEAVAEVRDVRAENAALRVVAEAAKKVCDGFDAGVFVRDVSHDHESGWAVRALPYLHALGVLAKNLGSLEPDAKRRPDMTDAGGETRRGARCARLTLGTMRRQGENA